MRCRSLCSASVRSVSSASVSKLSPPASVDRIFANRADRARHDRDAIPSIVSAPIEIEAARVFERLASRDKCPQISNLRVPGNCADCLVGKWFDQSRQRIALALCIGIDENDNAMTRGQRAPAAGHALCRDWAVATNEPEDRPRRHAALRPRFGRANRHRPPRPPARPDIPCSRAIATYCAITLPSLYAAITTLTGSA